MAHVVVLRGGRSLEREISLRSGHHVAAALIDLGHEVQEIDINDALGAALVGADLAFIALHGRDGEDGIVQQICESLGVAYTGSPPLTCRTCFDKDLAKGILRRNGVPTPDWYVSSSDAVRHMGAGASLRRAAERLGFPLVVKPTAQGSALGLAIVEDARDLTTAAMAAFDYGERVLLERFVEGAEVSVAVRGADLEALPAVRIQTASGVFDFETRVGPGAVELICPTPLDGPEVRRTAIAAAAELGVRDFGRVDMRITGDGPTVLDVKTCPGLTESSIVPLAVDRKGSTFTQFVDDVLRAALSRAPTAPAA